MPDSRGIPQKLFFCLFVFPFLRAVANFTGVHACHLSDVFSRSWRFLFCLFQSESNTDSVFSLRTFCARGCAVSRLIQSPSHNEDCDGSALSQVSPEAPAGKQDNLEDDAWRPEPEEQQQAEDAGGEVEVKTVVSEQQGGTF